MDFRTIWCLCGHRLVPFSRHLRCILLHSHILHRRHLLNRRWCDLFLGLSLLRRDILERPALPPLVLSPELGHDVIDCLAVGIFREALHRGQASLLDIHLVLCSSKHALMMHQDFLGESLEDPLVLERLQCGHTIHRVPVQAQVDEVKEFQILALLEHVLQRLCIR